jgi:hypothetical protein
MTAYDSMAASKATPTPAPAKVAPFKQYQTTSLRRECAELGVCQGFSPPCGLCAEHADLIQENRITVQDVAYLGAVLLLAVFTVVIVAGVAGYINVRFF